MDVKLLQDLFEIPKHPFGSRRVLPLLGHLLHEMTLTDNPIFALGDVPVGQGELFTFIL